MNNADQDEKIKRKYFDLLFAFGEERKGVRKLFTAPLRLAPGQEDAFFKWLHGEEFEEEGRHPDDGLPARRAMLDSSRVERLAERLAQRHRQHHQPAQDQPGGHGNDNRKLLMRSRDFRNMEEVWITFGTT